MRIPAPAPKQNQSRSRRHGMQAAKKNKSGPAPPTLHEYRTSGAGEEKGTRRREEESPPKRRGTDERERKRA